MKEQCIYLLLRIQITRLYQIVVGDKKYLKLSNVKVFTIPHYDKLRISDLVSFGGMQIDIDLYLPDYEYAKLPNIQWLCNVLNILIGPGLKKCIDDKVKQRAKYVVNKKQFSVKQFLSLLVYYELR